MMDVDWLSGYLVIRLSRSQPRILATSYPRNPLLLAFRASEMETFLQFKNMAAAMPLIFAGVLLVILVISFRSRAVVFCQYLEAMTGIRLKPSDVRRVYKERGRNGVRELFLDLIIREDLKEGPIDIPDEEVKELVSR